MDENAIIVKNITKTFKFETPRGVSKLLSNFSNDNRSKKTFNALNGISFTVAKGEAIGIIGLNGSGKTTLLRILAGILKPDHGSVEVNGKLSPVLQLGIGFQGDLNATDNIILNGMYLGASKSEMIEKVDGIIEWAELEKFSNMKLKHFSAGMRARLAFATMMELKPDIILLDEVLSVGDKIFKQKSYDAFLTIRKNKKTILHATHNLGTLAEFTDRILLLHQGKQIMIGKPSEVIETYKKLIPEKQKK